MISQLGFFFPLHFHMFFGFWSIFSFNEIFIFSNLVSMPCLSSTYKLFLFHSRSHRGLKSPAGICGGRHAGTRTDRSTQIHTGTRHQISAAIFCFLFPTASCSSCDHLLPPVSYSTIVKIWFWGDTACSISCARTNTHTHTYTSVCGGGGCVQRSRCGRSAGWIPLVMLAVCWSHGVKVALALTCTPRLRQVLYRKSPAVFVLMMSSGATAVK